MSEVFSKLFDVEPRAWLDMEYLALDIVLLLDYYFINSWSSLLIS